jgi:glycerol-3-phosphate dehydrogenase
VTDGWRDGRWLAQQVMSHGIPADRADLIRRLSTPQRWDLAVIGGGSTGLGIALDAATRGHSVVLVEASDFAKGTSSRATKLLHGGVRYLAQGNVRLVHEALHEREVILRNAPHLAQRLPFVIPAYRQRDRLLYGLGLIAYEALAGARSLGKTEWLSTRETLAALPGLRSKGLVGGIRYWDAQFDDARLALALARSAAAEGALVLNYCAARELLHAQGRVSGLVCEDHETGQRHEVQARCVINATGVWADALRQSDTADPAAFHQHLQPSRGAHIVLDRSFLPSSEALLVPRTSDGRVLFAIPWQGKLLAGTTDVPASEAVAEPVPSQEEISFILGELGRYLARAPTRGDVLSLWAGLRPLVRPDGPAKATRKIRRDHDILISDTGLVTVTGGKWTTYRVIASDTLATCISNGMLAKAGDCRTAQLPLVGAGGPITRGELARYGSEASQVAAMPGAQRRLCEGLTEGMVRFAARHEFARSVEDVLARRVRLLLLDARLAGSCAKEVDAILREELGGDRGLAQFEVLVRQYSGAGV